MKRCYMFKGGGYVYAANASEFVTEMRNSTRHQNDTLIQYMNGVAARCFIDSRVIISANSHEEFLHDLIANGFVIAMPI